MTTTLQGSQRVNLRSFEIITGFVIDRLRTISTQLFKGRVVSKSAASPDLRLHINALKLGVMCDLAAAATKNP